MFAARRLGWAMLVLAGLGCTSTASWAVDGKLLPDNTEIVISINLKQILNSELAKSKDVQDLIAQLKLVASQLPGTDQALKYLEKLGLSPARDLSILTLAHPGNKNPEELFIVVEGNFDLARFEAAAKDAAKEFGDGIRVTRVNKVTVLEVTTAQGVVYVGLLSNKNLVIAARQEAVKDAAARSSGRAGGPRKDVLELLKTANEKQSVSFVVSGKVLAGLGQGIGALGPAIPAVDGVSGSLTFAGEVTFQLGVGSKDAAAARELADQVHLGLLLLRTIAAQQAVNNPQIGPLVGVANSLRVSVTGSNTVVTGEVSYENLGKLFKSFGGK